MRKIFAFLFLAISCAASFAADPPAGTLRKLIKFKESVGNFDFFQSDEIPEMAAQSLKNVDYQINGSLRRRRGVENFVSVTSPFVQIGGGAVNDSFWIYKTTTNHSYFISRISGAIGHSAGFDIGYFDQNILQPFVTGQVDAIQADGNFYVVSEVTPIVKLTEVQPLTPLNMSYISKSPAGRIIKSHLDRFLVTGSTRAGEENIVYYSSANFIGTWPEDNFFEVFAQSGERITCLGDPIFGNLPLYTNRTTRLITGSDYPDPEDSTSGSEGNINVRLVYDGIGCSSPRSVKNVRNKQYFFSSGQDGQFPGIYEFNGVSVKEKTKPIRNFFKNSVQNSTATLAVGYVYGDQYCLNVATNGCERPAVVVCVDETDRIWKYDPLRVGMLADLNGVAYAAMDIDQRTQTPCNGRSSNYHIGQYDKSDEFEKFGDGTSPNLYYPISWSYKTKDFSMSDQGGDNSARQKFPDRAYIKTSVSTMTPTYMNVQANYDYGTSSTNWRIDVSTIYKTGNILTVMKSSSAVVNKLLFDSGVRNLDFIFINFEISSSSNILVDSLDFYAGLRPLK